MLAARGDQTDLVGILDEDILPLGLLEAQVGNGSHDSPSVRQVDIHLRSKISRLVPLGTEDGVTRRVAGVNSRNITKQTRFEVRRKSKNRRRR